MKKIIGIDLGGTNVRIGLVNEMGELEAYEKIPTKQIFVTPNCPEGDIEQLVRQFCDNNVSNGYLPDAVSIGFPSTISKDQMVVIQTPNIESIPDNFEAVRLLKERLNIEVFINRDVNNLLMYDIKEMGLPDSQDIVAIYYGTGLGNAIMINGKIITGKNGVAGELGHIPVLGNNKKCSCGNIGCLETVCSGLVLEDIHKKYYPETNISDLFEKHQDDEVIKNFVKMMAQVLDSEINLFDPDYCIVGGGLVQMKDFPKEYFEKMVTEYARKPYPAGNISIKYSRENQQNGVIGSALNGFSKMN